MSRLGGPVGIIYISMLFGVCRERLGGPVGMICISMRQSTLVARLLFSYWAALGKLPELSGLPVHCLSGGNRNECNSLLLNHYVH